MLLTAPSALFDGQRFWVSYLDPRGGGAATVAEAYRNLLGWFEYRPPSIWSLDRYCAVPTRYNAFRAALLMALAALPDKVPYPVTGDGIPQQWPGDYYWLFPAMVLMLLGIFLEGL